jgi:hypothetical protein
MHWCTPYSAFSCSLSVCLSVISLLPSKWSLEISTQNAKYHLELQSPAVSLRLSHGLAKLANGCALILSLTLSLPYQQRNTKDFLTCWEWTTYVETSFAEWTDCEKKPEEKTEYIRTKDSGLGGLEGGSGTRDRASNSAQQQQQQQLAGLLLLSFT